MLQPIRGMIAAKREGLTTVRSQQGMQRVSIHVALGPAIGKEITEFTIAADGLSWIRELLYSLRIGTIRSRLNLQRKSDPADSSDIKKV